MKKYKVIVYFVFVLSCAGSIVFAQVAQTPVGETRPQTAEKVSLLLSRLSLEEKIGQLFIIEPNPDGSELSVPVGGYILFSRHTQNQLDTMALTQKLRSNHSLLPPFIAVDQEGGRVARLSFISKLPTASQLAALRPETVNKIAWLLGSELYSLGFNLNFAPVMDVATRAENPVIGDRSFSPDPYTVAILGAAFIDGLQSAGVSACAKHFPGHGDTRTDSHLTLPILDHTRDRIDRIELLPFQAAVHHNVDMIMIGHLHLPIIDPTRNLPATLSRPIVTELLRQQLGYEGVIITDAMNMNAITDGFSSEQAAVMAFNAGVDIILMPADFARAYSALLAAVKHGEITHSRIDESLTRILKLKHRLLIHKTDPLFPNQNHAGLQLDLVGSSSLQRWLDKLLQDNIELDGQPQNSY